MSSEKPKRTYSNSDSLHYLKQNEISSVLSIALGELYLAKPRNQLYFLGNWLVNYSRSQKNLNQELAKEEVQAHLREKYQQSLISQSEIEEKLQIEAEKVKEKDSDFRKQVSESTDLDDLLQSFIEHLKISAHAAAGYIGVQERIKRPVTPFDDEKAHIDDEAPLVIRYITASDNHKFMIDKVLKEEEGLATWSLWKEEEEETPEEEVEEGADKKPKVKVLSIDDVVNDPRIKFFDVPKLGAYFAVPLNYKSCLYESSFDAGVDDFLECRKLRAQQEDEKAKMEASVKDDEEVKVFEEIKEAPFKSTEVKLVVALDTLGQDRPFTSEEKSFVIEWVGFFKEQWERSETEALKRDLKTYMPMRDKDQQRLHDKHVEWADEEKAVNDEAIKSLLPSLPEDFKNLEAQAAIFELMRKRVLQEVDCIFNFRFFKVVKFSRVFQIAFYLNGAKREEIVEPGTNMIMWKKGKLLLNSQFHEFLTNVKPRGPKDVKPEAYAKTYKLQRDLLKIPFEEVQNFCVALGFLYKFLEFYLKVRIFDVNFRRKEYSAKVEVRENALAAAKELAERKQKYLDDAKEAFDKEMEAIGDDDERSRFDSVKVLQDFDAIEGNAPIQIPEAILPDEDADIDWDESEAS